MSAQELATIIVGLVVLLILLFLYWNCRCRSEPTSTPRWPRDRKATMDVEQAPKTSNNDSSRSRLEVTTVKTDGGHAPKEHNNDPSPSPSQKNKVTKVKTDGGQAPKEQNNDPSPSQKNKVTKVKMGGGQNPKEQNNDPSPSQKNKVTEVKTDGGQAPKEQKHDPSPSKKIKVKEVKTDGGQAPKEQNNDPSPSPSQENKVNEAKTDGGQAPKEQNNDPSPSLSQNNKVNKAKTDGGQAPKEQNNDPSPSQSQKNKVNEAKTDGGQAPKEQNNDPSPSPSQKNKVTEAKTDGGQAPKEQNNDPSPSQKNNVTEVKTDGEQVPKEQNNDPSPSQKNKDKTNGGQAQDSQWNAPPRSDHGLQTGSSSSGPDNSLTCPRPGIAFTYPTLEKATNRFSRANFLGVGGFGPVHKGVVTIDKEGVLPFDKEEVPPYDIEIAVKQLKSGSQQGNAEFEAEVKIISRVHHRHLVTLLGHCISGKQRLLVYEFVPNNTLHFHLHGKDQPAMELSTRLKIALGSARGLAYLHEDCNPKIIHRDIKAANILLDSKFEPKVADFGLAKVLHDDKTHVSTKIKGTFGHLAPEYWRTGQLTIKADVYSFGVVLLELITGRRPVGEQGSSNDSMQEGLVVWPLLTGAIEKGNYEPLVDPRLQKNYNCNEMKRMVACAAACVRETAEDRPRMNLVSQVLVGVVSTGELKISPQPRRTGRS